MVEGKPLDNDAVTGLSVYDQDGVEVYDGGVEIVRVVGRAPVGDAYGQAGQGVMDGSAAQRRDGIEVAVDINAHDGRPITEVVLEPGPIFCRMARMGRRVICAGFRPKSLGGSAVERGGVKPGMMLISVNGQDVQRMAFEVSIGPPPGHRAPSLLASRALAECSNNLKCGGFRRKSTRNLAKF